MLQKYSFIAVFGCLLGGLSWLSANVQSSANANLIDPKPAQVEESSRRIPHESDLVEVLDRAVAYEHYYHSVYGHFTKLLNKIGFTIPESITDYYDIRVSEVSSEKLLISAFSEANGKVLELASIDQDYQIHANFAVPPPRPAYLKLRAIRHLRQLRSAPNGQAVAEDGVFKGYFQYSVQSDSVNEKVAVATGILPPVKGIQLEVNARNEVQSESEWGDPLSDNEKEDDVTGDYSVRNESKTGQRTLKDVASLEEEAYLAQQIFRGEVGRYAKNWSELSKITNFHFEGRDQESVDQDILFEGSKGPYLSRKISSSPTSKKPLEIEQISSQ